MYVETSGDNYGEKVFVSSEGTDIIQISNITFYQSPFSAGNWKSMGSFRIQITLPNGQWHSKIIIDENINYSDTSTQWKLLDVDFTESN